MTGPPAPVLTGPRRGRAHLVGKLLQQTPQPLTMTLVGKMTTSHFRFNPRLSRVARSTSLLHGYQFDTPRYTRVSASLDYDYTSAITPLRLRLVGNCKIMSPHFPLLPPTSLGVAGNIPVCPRFQIISQQATDCLLSSKS